MIKIPHINILTPPIKDPFKQPAKPKSTGTGSGSGATPSFESIFEEMLKRYLPETVSFTPLGEDVLRETISNWLRPAYEQAIRSRRERTERQNAELDADAWARGMGASTYVTDVKDRAFRSEAQDVSDLESDYASALAGQLYDAMRAQQEQKIAVDQFNAEQINHARERAADEAQALYSAYLAAGGGSGKGVQQTPGSFLEALLAGIDPSQNGAPQTDDTAKVDYKPAVSAQSGAARPPLCGRRRVRAAQRGDPRRHRTGGIRAVEEAVPGRINPKEARRLSRAFLRATAGLQRKLRNQPFGDSQSARDMIY